MGFLRRKKWGILPLEKRLMLDASLPALTGQVLWLDASDTSTILDAEGDNAASGASFSGTVATWVDKSSSGYNVSAPIASEQPTYSVGALNGENVITFDGINDRLVNTTATVAGNDASIFIVFDRTSSSSRDGVIEVGSGGSRTGLWTNDASASGKYNYYMNGTFYSSSASYTVGNYSVVSMVQNVTSAQMYVDGVSTLSATTSARSSTTGIYIADDSTSNDWMQGNIAEIIIYDRALSAEETHDVENYLASKWGLSITNIDPAVSTNSGLTLNEGATASVLNTVLSVSDADNTDSTLIYTLTDAVDYGTLTNTNTGLSVGVGDTFTQGDINSGYIVYTHDGSETISDSFSFTVSDQFVTTAASSFSITITPVNEAPVISGWTQVSSENFESGATGWSDNTTTSGGTYFTTYLGRHSQEAGSQNTYKTYSLSGTQDYTVISFDLYEIDSWDGESFRVFIDDTQVMSVSLSASSFNSIASGASGAVSWTAQAITAFNAGMGGSGTWSDQGYHITMTVNTTAASVKLGFSSTLDQGITDEAWGVDNVNIYEVGSASTPGPYSVAENSTAGTVVGTVTATDPDAGDTLSYSIIGGTGAGLFTINPTTGVLTVTSSSTLNYEATNSYTLQVRVTDSGGLTDTEIVTVNIINVVENTAPALTGFGTVSIPENSTVGTVVGTVSSVDAESNTVTYSITAGNTDGLFSINSSTGVVTLSSVTNLNYEYDNSYTLTIRAVDNGFGALASTTTVTINITNSNEAPSFAAAQEILFANPSTLYNATTGNFYRYVGTAANFASATSAANAATLNGVSGYLVTSTSAVENAFLTSLITTSTWLGGSDTAVEGNWIWGGGADAGQMFWQGNASGSAQNGYYTNWNTGEPNDSGVQDAMQLYTSGKWDDIQTTATLPYIIEWTGSSVIAGLSDGPFSIAENSAVNSSVGFVTAADPDSGDTISYSITGGTGASYFAVNASTGEITLTNAAAANYELASSYTLDLRVQDAAGLFDTVTVTINITDVNESPVVTGFGPVSIAENAVVGTALGTVTSVDPDSNTVSYSIVGGNSDNLFSINSSTGVVTLTSVGNLNYERDNSYTLTIRGTDNGTGSLTGTTTVTVNITDVNEAPSFSAIQEVLYSDPSVVYSAATGNFYKYVGTSANVAAATAAANAATLNGVSGYLATSTSAAENAFLTSLIVGNTWLGASDSAVEGEWSWTGGPDAGITFWSGTGTGSAQNGYYTNWNGSEPNNSGNEDAIQIYTSGRWNDLAATNSLPYIIEWTGADVMSGMSDGPYTLIENSAVNTSVGFATAVDLDSGDTISYSITGGTGASYFAVHASTGEITLTNASAANYELASSYTLDLRVQDAAGLFDTVTVTINITDVNESPVLDINTGAALNEGASIIISNSMLSSSDVDAPPDTGLAYLLSSSVVHGTLFNSNTGLGLIAGDSFTQGDLDSGYIVYTHDDSENFSDGFSFTVSDGSLSIGVATFSLTINPVNEGPAFLSTGPYSISENVALHTSVGLLTSFDPDTADVLTYSITGGSGASYFSVNSATGEITLVDPSAANYEISSLYTLNVRVQDIAGLFDTAVVTVNILDANDAPTDIGLTGNRVVENSAVGTVVGLLSSTDEDVADTHSYSLVGNPGGKFVIVGNELRVAAPIDYEQYQSIRLVVRTDDGQGGVFDKAFTIRIEDVMDTTATGPSTGIPQGSGPSSAVGGMTYSLPDWQEGLVRASVLQGEEGQISAFYGIGKFVQILRENTTFEIRRAVQNIESFALDIIRGDRLDENLVSEKKEYNDVHMEDHYTRLEQALDFLSQIERKDGVSPLDQSAVLSAKPLEYNPLDQQFVDIMTYHEKRQEHLRKALLSV